jgi:predicted AlkP superfamily phosphohydrolase/phosphomutase
MVAPEDYESERDALMAKFAAAKIPGTDQPLFKGVYRGEDVYARKKELDLPDIVLDAADGIHPRKKLTRGSSVRLIANPIGGMHRQNGIYAFAGEGVQPSGGIGRTFNIADIAPTLLQVFGQPIPKRMTGRPIPDLIDDPPAPHYVDEAPHSPGTAHEIYSPAEESVIEERLKDLGYLE